MMRVLIVAFALLGLLLAGPASAQDRFTVASASPSQFSVKAGEDKAAHVTESKTILAKIKWRRTCPANQMRCACADTGTSACCTDNQQCDCSPTATCR
jgi:hypothetical protein